jgi:membrane protein DedA with SNARE-associated domain
LAGRAADAESRHPPLIATLIGIPANLGYLALALLVGLESSGVPVPGETALIASGVVASRGELSIELVIVIAATAAIVGDNIGYWIGRKGGRRLLTAEGPLREYRLKVIEHGQPFFQRHGAKSVFLGRWFAGLRIAAAWLAGINHMPWRTFLFWNALGGMAWALSVGLLAYLLGPTAEDLFKTFGIAGAGLVVAVLIGLFLWPRYRFGDRSERR